MKNNELHNFLRDLHAEDVQTPLFAQGLRRSILNKNRKQPFVKRVAAGFNPRKDTFLRTRQRYVSYGSLAMVLVLVLSLTVYSYRFSPKAEAQQVINDSLVSLQAVPSNELISLENQLGGDPAAELKEAKAAKDVTVITKDEFVALGKNAKSVVASSLSSDPNAPKITSVSFNGGAGGAVMAKGTVSTKAGASGEGYGVSTVAVGSAGGSDSATYSTDGAAGSVTVSSDGSTVSSGTFVTGSTVPTSGPTTTMPVPVDGEPVLISGEAGTASGGDVMAYSAGVPGDAAQPTSFKIKPLSPFKVTEPDTYLKYTNSKGQVVVLSLDAKGLPIYKTLFIGKKS